MVWCVVYERKGEKAPFISRNLQLIKQGEGVGEGFGGYGFDVIEFAVIVHNQPECSGPVEEVALLHHNVRQQRAHRVQHQPIGIDVRPEQRAQKQEALLGRIGCVDRYVFPSFLERQDTPMAHLIQRDLKVLGDIRRWLINKFLYRYK